MAEPELLSRVDHLVYARAELARGITEIERSCALRTARSDYSYGILPEEQVLLRVATLNNAPMPDTALPVALCCYRNRTMVVNRCDLCKSEYACPEFKSKAAVMKFNALIPPSMLLAPLPIELWPRMCANVAPALSSQSTRQSSSIESTECPVRRFVSTLIDGDPQAI
jgi:hypothetical protein